MFEKPAFHGHRLTSVAQAAMTMRVSATSVSCQYNASRTLKLGASCNVLRYPCGLRVEIGEAKQAHYLLARVWLQGEENVLAGGARNIVNNESIREVNHRRGASVVGGQLNDLQSKIRP